MGYHKTKIEKGKIGELSKIKEELSELEDSLQQGVKIMALVELSDLYGAIEEYVIKNYGMTMTDLKSMSDVTKKAFKDGTRK